MTLRPYQSDLVGSVHQSWNQGAQNVLMRLDTGGGKTVCIGDIVKRHAGASCVIAHRSELVSQLSVALGREKVRHNIICSDKDRRAIAEEHMEKFGRVYLEPAAPCAVASVDTLIRRDNLDSWQRAVTLWVTDEGHHTLRGNKWGRAVSKFVHPHVKGLLPTATPKRADGMGLGRQWDGLADVMVEGPPARWLMAEGYLTRYRVAAADSHVQEFLGEVSKSGDWTNTQLRAASRQSTIVGDVVQSYKQHAYGKLGVTFASDVETATEMAHAYNLGGVPAAVLTGDTESGVRRAMLRQFARREIWQICAVDVISEGFDLPAVEAVTMARATASLQVFLQQLGRGLRPADGKLFCQLIDHVGNFLRHRGGPDTPRDWTLERRERKSKAPDDEIPLRLCINIECGLAYERFRKTCPHCGHPAPPPAGRSGPAEVEGELGLLSEDILAGLRGEVDTVDMDRYAYAASLAAKHCPTIAIPRHVRYHDDRQTAQGALRQAMAQWGGYRRAEGLSDVEMQRAFWFQFGVSVLEAQALGVDDALRLLDRVVRVR